MFDGPFQSSFIQCGRQLTKQLNTFNTFFNTNKYKIHNGWDARNVGYCSCKNLQYLIRQHTKKIQNLMLLFSF